MRRDIHITVLPSVGAWEVVNKIRPFSGDDRLTPERDHGKNYR